MECQEEWRPVVGYEGLYEVSNLGRVRSLPRTMKSRRGKEQGGYHLKGRVLKQHDTGNGYLAVPMTKGVCKMVHRLVLEAFVPNPDNKPCCDHIDANRKNNRVENLRWATYSENNSHPHAVSLRSRQVLQLDKNTGDVIRRFDSTKEAGIAVGSMHVGSCCLGKRKTAGGYKWKYANNETNNS